MSAALLHAIRENPADDTPRLVYADWLDENATADWQRHWAELIRRQIAKAEPPYTANVFQTVFGWQGIRSGVLLPTLNPDTPVYWGYYRDIAEDDTPMPYTARVSRGFVDKIILPVADFMQWAGELFAVAPITEVRLSDREPLDNPTGDAVCWFWSCQSRWDNAPAYRNDSDNIPDKVFKFLEPDRFNVWPTEADAHKALSDACVKFGRKAAGLPSLTQET